MGMLEKWDSVLGQGTPGTSRTLGTSGTPETPKNTWDLQDLQEPWERMKPTEALVPLGIPGPLGSLGSRDLQYLRIIWTPRTPRTFGPSELLGSQEPWEIEARTSSPFCFPPALSLLLTEITIKDIWLDILRLKKSINFLHYSLWKYL